MTLMQCRMGEKEKGWHHKRRRMRHGWIPTTSVRRFGAHKSTRFQEDHT